MDEAKAVDQTTDGGYIVAVWTGFSDVLLMKINAAAEVEWDQILGAYGHEIAYSVKQTTDGHRWGSTSDGGIGEVEFMLGDCFAALAMTLVLIEQKLWQLTKTYESA